MGRSRARWWAPAMRRRSPAPLSQALDDPAAAAEIARQLRDRVAVGFTVEAMVDDVLAAYGAALEARRHAVKTYLSIPISLF